jgi:hypothetical protein
MTMRMNAVRILGPALIAVVGTGCSASGPAFEKIAIPEGKSVIYTYRPSSFFGAALSPMVVCGGKGVGLKPGGYHPIIVDPGPVLCTASTESTSEVNVEAAPGAENYVRETIGIGVLVGRPHLLLMDAAQGETDARKCRLQP